VSQIILAYVSPFKNLSQRSR